VTTLVGAPQTDAITGASVGLDQFGELIEIGAGGDGVVYRAHQPELHRDVAVKVIRATALDEGALARFDRERTAMGRLSSHPAIVTVHDAGFTGRGQPYLVMEHMAGGTLADRVAAHGPLPWAEALDVAIRLADALAAAHAAGVLHRDVKPQNILISAYGDVKLGDFGVSGLVESEAVTVQFGRLPGTLEHVAPEVLAGDRASAGSDIYSLASTIYALLTGTPAFRHPTDEMLVQVIQRVIFEEPPDLRPFGVPACVAATIERGMAKDPSGRPPSAEQFAAELRAARETPQAPASTTVPSGASASVPGASAASAPVDVHATHRMPIPGRDLGASDHPALAADHRRWGARLRWRRSPLVPAVLLVVDLLAVAIWLALRAA
jgi:serine/threonine-protein kinase PknK